MPSKEVQEGLLSGDGAMDSVARGAVHKPALGRKVIPKKELLFLLQSDSSVS